MDTLDCNDDTLLGNELNDDTVELNDDTVVLNDDTVVLNDDTVVLNDDTSEFILLTVELNEDSCDVRVELTLDSIVDMEL